MVIRCERCSTLYELDESLLSPAGSEVQCTKCQHVFVAHPPRSAGRTLVGMPVEPGAPAEPVRTPDSAGQREPSAPERTRVPQATERSSNPEAPRAARPAAPAVYHPSGPAPAVRSPVLKRDTVGAFEARLRRHARWKWLGPSLAAALVVCTAAGVIALRRRAEAGRARARADAMALVALDDSASVEAGTARLDDELSRSPRDPKVAGDRALAQVVSAAAIVEEGEGLAARLAARSAERERLRREQPAGWEEAERKAAAEARALEGEIRAREDKARALCASALETLRVLQRNAGESSEVLRGLAAYYALGGERERALKAVRSSRERGSVDGWIDLAEAWTEARDPDSSARERALVKLGAVAAMHPELLRARVVLARTQAALGRRGEALATVEGLLAANARHEGAKRLKAELLAPPRLPPVVNQPTPSRNPVAQQAPSRVSRRSWPVEERGPTTGRAVAPSVQSPTSPVPPANRTPPAMTSQTRSGHQRSPSGTLPAPAGPSPKGAVPSPAPAGPSPTRAVPSPAPAVPSPAPAGPSQTRAVPSPAPAGPSPTLSPSGTPPQGADATSFKKGRRLLHTDQASPPGQAQGSGSTLVRDGG